MTYLEYGLDVPDGLMVTYDKILPDDGDVGEEQQQQQDPFEDEFDEYSADEDDHTVCIFDSPLSSDPSDSRLSIEVVAVYAEDRKEEKDQLQQQQQGGPSMAMVVVKKPQSANGSSGGSTNNLMVSGLFDDAKKRIIKALDKGLDDWSGGKIRAEEGSGRRGTGASSYTVESSKKTKDKESPSYIDADAEDQSYSGPADVANKKDGVFEQSVVNWDRAIIDADVLKSEKEGTAEKGFKPKRSKTTNKSTARTKAEVAATSKKSAPSVGNDDFAVKAARAAAAAAARKSKTGVENTVTAGKKKKRPSKAKKDRQKVSKERSEAISKPRQAPLPLASLADAASSSVEMSPSGPRFRVSLNKPKRPGQERRQANIATRTKASAMPPKAGISVRNDKVDDKAGKDDSSAPAPHVNMPSGQEDYAVAAAKAAARIKDIGSDVTSNVAEEKSNVTFAGKKRNINAIEYDSDQSKRGAAVNYDDIMFDGRPDSPPTNVTSGDAAALSDTIQQDGDVKTTKTDAEIERDVMAAAAKFMPSPDDMSAEQLLKDVLKFGDEMEKEEAPGTGFATGAFEKAKELMQGSSAKRKEDRRRGLGFKELQSSSTSQQEFFSNLESSMDQRHADKPLTVEEELKQIFAAGERMAEGKLATTEDSGDAAMTVPDVVNDEYIDELIASDKSVPLNARILDDELAQLEVRMSKSVDETDASRGGRGPNPLFDVMSGPETYNPNVVDPTNTINWPGAQPGTRNVRLPRALDEAVTNAQFAAKILMNMTEEVDEDGGTRKYFVGGEELSQKQVQDVRMVVEEAVAVGLIEDPLLLMAERARLNILVKELKGQDDRFGDIASEYKDLLLSDNFIPIVKGYLNSIIERDLEAKRRGEEVDGINERHQEEREIITKLIQYAQVLLKQVRALGAELEASHLEVIRSICHVAMDPSHTTEEETSMALTDAVQDMRPMFDDSFVAYLKYAIAEEEAKLARAGVLDDPEYNRWLFVLKVIQEGVYKELSKSISRLLEHIWYILRMESKSERRMLLEKLVDVMPTLDVRPFVNVVDNIVSSLGGATKGEFDADVVGDMTNKLLQLKRDVNEVLHPERVKEMSRDADEWADGQRKRLMEARETTRKRLANAAETDAYDPDEPGRGEIERMT